MQYFSIAYTTIRNSLQIGSGHAISTESFWWNENYNEYRLFLFWEPGNGDNGVSSPISNPTYNDLSGFYTSIRNTLAPNGIANFFDTQTFDFVDSNCRGGRLTCIFSMEPLIGKKAKALHNATNQPLPTSPMSPIPTKVSKQLLGSTSICKKSSRRGISVCKGPDTVIGGDALFSTSDAKEVFTGILRSATAQLAISSWGGIAVYKYDDKRGELLSIITQSPVEWTHNPTPPYKLTLGRDGNLCASNGAGVTYWCSYKYGASDGMYRATLQNDGNFVVYRVPSNQVIWSSGSAVIPAYGPTACLGYEK